MFVRPRLNPYPSQTITIFFIALSLMVIASISGAANAKPGIIEYYDELRQGGEAGLEYKIEQRAGGWAVKAAAWNTYLPIQVDQANGYIKIYDEGTGGGATEIQAALWLLKNREPLIGIAQSVFDEGIPQTGSLLFFRKQHGNWLNVTDAVFHPVRLQDFIRVAMVPIDRTSLIAIGAHVYYDLPRYGTTISAYLALNKHLIQAVCSGDDSISIRDPALFHHHCNDLDDRLANVMQIDWRKLDGSFARGVPDQVEIEPWSKPGIGIEDRAPRASDPAAGWITRNGIDTRGYSYAYTRVKSGDSEFVISCTQGSRKFDILLTGNGVQNLERKDDAVTQLSIALQSGKGETPRHPVKVWYFGSDRAWTGQMHPGALFLQHFARADNVYILNQHRMNVAVFPARRTARAAQAMAKYCGRASGGQHDHANAPASTNPM